MLSADTGRTSNISQILVRLSKEYPPQSLTARHCKAHCTLLKALKFVSSVVVNGVWLQSKVSSVSVAVVTRPERKKHSKRKTTTRQQNMAIDNVK